MDIGELIKSLPAEITYNDREGCLQITHEFIGWHSTYTYYDFDIIDLDYYSTLEESLEVLIRWLKENEKI